MTGTAANGSEMRVIVEIIDDGLAVAVSCIVAEENVDALAEHILLELKSLGVRHQWDAPGLMQWLREHAEQSARIERGVLVRGQAPVWPQDGMIEWGAKFFDAGYLMDEATGTIDYRRHAAQVAVKEDQFLARVVPARPGTAGHDVFGKRIEIQKATTPQLRIGANVRADATGSEFHATKDGRIRWSDDTLTVDPVYRVSGSVDLAVGDIVHYGAIVVECDVLQGARIEASGDIEITGSAEPSNITCGGTLVVHGAIMGGEGHAIDVAGGIRARLIAGADIEAGGDIVVEREIVNSHIKTSGRIQMPHGRLVGGNVIAHGGIRAGQLGTHGAVRTVLRVGEDYQLKAEIEAREKRASEISGTLAEYGEKARLIHQHMERLTAQQQEMATHLFATIDELRSALNALHEETEAIRSASRTRAKLVVDVATVVYPETIIGMEGEWMHVDEELQGPLQFRFLGGTVVIRTGHSEDVLP